MTNIVSKSCAVYLYQMPQGNMFYVEIQIADRYQTVPLWVIQNIKSQYVSAI